MSDKKSNFCRFISLIISISFLVTSTAAFAAPKTPADKLATGKQLYSQGKYNQAMDNFIDVFVGGNSEQIAEANEYVNMIHFNMGAVEAPKQVAFDASLEKARKDGQGKELFDKDGVAIASKQAKTPGANATVVAAAPVKPVEQIIVEDADLDFNTEEQRTLRKGLIDADILSMTEKMVAKLQKTEGVNVYMRGGLVDAVDINSDIIFNGDRNTFSVNGKKVLDDVYALMVLSGTPTFVLLPPGSYTDEVSIQGVRQAIALNSYLVSMGISSAKINFNMGLTHEQAPAKFSNLEGISIVFDYTTKPVLKQTVTDKKAAPRLSLAMYPFESITPADDQGMVVDFSVIQTANPIADWKLQIVQHTKDGKYYVVRQLSGTDAIYKQFYWNGKKQYFGQILPIGRYTMILKAQDTNGQEKIVRRKVELLGKDTPKKAEAKKAKAAAVIADTLNYKAVRLWTKPARHMKNAQAEIAVTEEDDYYFNTDLSTAATAAPTAGVNTFGSVATQPAAPVEAPASSAAAQDPLSNPYPAQQPADDGLTPDAANYDY